MKEAGARDAIRIERESNEKLPALKTGDLYKT